MPTEDKIPSPVIREDLPLRLFDEFVFLPLAAIPAMEAKNAPIGDHPNRTTRRTPMPERGEEQTNTNQTEHEMKRSDRHISCKRGGFRICRGNHNRTREAQERQDDRAHDALSDRTLEPGDRSAFAAP